MKRAFFALALLAASLGQAEAWDVSYWVWNRAAPLHESELIALRAQQVSTLFWQAGAIENVGESWRWKSRCAVPGNSAELRIVPVLRLESRERNPFSDAAMEALLAIVAGTVHDAPELQIDFDCPDRLIAEYGAALRKIRAHVPRLSITALPSWSRVSVLRELERSVDELAPMLYDFAPDPPINGTSALPIPLLAGDILAQQLAAWDQCKIPWRAGLPTFSRLTLFNAGGASCGHIRNWTWADLCFNSALTFVRPTENGVTLFRAQKDGSIARTPVQKDDLVAARWPDRAALADAVASAKKTSALGVTFFRLPDATDPSGWSLRQLGNLSATEPRLVLRRSGAHELSLVNESDADLEVRFGGYALELEAPAPIFREALAGDFYSVAAATPGAIQLATRLIFRFSHLRAGESLRTGLIQLAAGVDWRQLRYRITDREWKNIAD